jgi:riboflavin kinase/FMN adenylyltransferase
MVLSPATFSGDIIALDEKLNIFEKMGVTRTILIDFSEKFSKMKGSVFIEYLIKRGLVFLAVGSNFRCGHCLSTDAREIRRMTGERGIETEIVPSVLFEGEPISSSRIRTAIAAGDFEKVKAALGRN